MKRLLSSCITPPQSPPPGEDTILDRGCFPSFFFFSFSLISDSTSDGFFPCDFFFRAMKRPTPEVALFNPTYHLMHFPRTIRPSIGLTFPSTASPDSHPPTLFFFFFIPLSKWLYEVPPSSATTPPPYIPPLPMGECRNPPRLFPFPIASMLNPRAQATDAASASLSRFLYLAFPLSHIAQSPDRIIVLAVAILSSPSSSIEGLSESDRIPLVFSCQSWTSHLVREK